jgi:hypothetical protein
MTKRAYKAIVSLSASDVSDSIGIYSDSIDLSITGTFVGTVLLQRSWDLGLTWGTLETFTTITEKNVKTASKGFIYRLNFTWTSGTMNGYIGVG